MTCGIARLFVEGITAIVFASSFFAANAQTAPCQTPLVTVETDDPALHTQICKTVASILPTLERCHLVQREPVTITVSESLENTDGLCFGLYHPKTERIELLEMEEFERARERTGNWTSIPSAEHYDSIVVHEVVHALANQTSLVERNCNVDEEYIAYAMQIESLSDSSRAALLESVGAPVPKSLEELNPFILSFSPPFFAAKAWLHYSQEENGCDFIEKLISGEVTLFLYPE